MNELLAAVLDYAQRGWRVIALHHITVYNGATVCSCRRRGECKAAGKHPVFSKWREIATTDAERLKSWWRYWPRANIGVLMGGATGIICLDIDGEKGRESLKQLEEIHGALPETLMQSTGRVGGGVHHIYRVDPFYADWIKNRAAVAPGIDVRSEGGLIVAAPSIHPTGAKYQWRNTKPIAELPEWLFKLFISQRERQKEMSSSGERLTEEQLEAMGWPLERRLKKARIALTSMPEAIQGNNGSTACLRAAIVIIRGYCVPVEPHSFAFEMLWNDYNPRCEPPWADWELIHKIETAEFNVAAPWGYRLDSDPEAGYTIEQVDGIMASAIAKSPAPSTTPPQPKENPTVIIAPQPLPLTTPVAAPERHRRAPRKPRLPKTPVQLAWATHPVDLQPDPEPVAATDEDDEDVEGCA
jgi:hypothetical protein